MAVAAETSGHKALAGARFRDGIGIDVLIMVAVLAVELAATYGSMTGEPLRPVDDWGTTRPTDWAAFTAVAVGCVALAWRRTRPVLALLAAALPYCAYILLDYELGLFLPVMAMLYTAAARGGTRLWGAAAAAAALAVSLLWVYRRVLPVDEPGVVLLAWAAFGTVCTVFFLGPLLVGELVRCIRLLRAHNSGAQGDGGHDTALS